MRGELVAVDLETTGLDINSDAIIEVGAVRFRDGIVIERYSRLINPGFPIPPNITHLTGITTDDVSGQPGIMDVLSEIAAFIGSAPVVGHNVNFDAGFLARYGLIQDNPRIDTYDLASVLIPRAPRYNLNSLTSGFDIVLENAHRALADAEATAYLYWQLWQKVLALPYTTLTEIVDAGGSLNWNALQVFNAALAELAPAQAADPADIRPTFDPPPDNLRPLRPVEDIQALHASEVVHIVEDDGDLAHSLPGYEHRPQQVEMTRLVTDAFNHGMHIMIEAGTGTGKSIAYLIPAMAWSTLNQDRIVVSTNTINLQDQLIEKDIPMLTEALNLPVQATVLKGRSNYLCPRRLAAVRRRRPTSIDELRTLAKILVWLLESSTGDRGEITLRGPVENITWQRLSAEDEGCTLDRCRSVMGGVCPFYKARKKAEASHLVVVNHALLLSDATSENRVLPEYHHLILDEAHHLEDAVTNGLSFRLDEATLRRRIADLGGPKRGLLGDLLNNVTDTLPDKEVKRLTKFVTSISDAAAAMEHHIGALFKAARAFVDDVEARNTSEYTVQTRIVPALRERTTFMQLEKTWQTLAEFLDVISEAMQRLTETLARMEQYDIPDFNDIVNSTGSASRYLREISHQLHGFILEPDPNMIYWISTGQDVNQTATLNAAPLHVGPMVERYLWSAKDTIVMTSATLRTNGNFDYIRERLHADHIEVAEVGSPFNYTESTLLYIPTDMPEPNEKHLYQQAVERGIIELAASLQGRVMVLFTSYTHLRQTAQAIAPRLALGDIVVYDQSDGTSRQALVEGFKSTEKAVLLGTRSFWEGVDIPGDSLSALVIVRLPFAVPSDPIFAARSETYTNSFQEFAVPDAILRFRQGFGRLIRTGTDRGIVAVFDRRIISKRYGMAFLEALPDCTVMHGDLKALPGIAKDWLKRI